MTSQDLKSLLLQKTAQFTWLFGQEFFLETEVGNFIWRDPEYNGDNSVRPYGGSLLQYLGETGVPYGRDKGEKMIARYIGDTFTVVLNA